MRIEALPTPYSRLARCRSETPVARASALRLRPRRSRNALARSPSAARKGSLRSAAASIAASGSTVSPGTGAPRPATETEDTVFDNVRTRPYDDNKHNIASRRDEQAGAAAPVRDAHYSWPA